MDKFFVQKSMRFSITIGEDLAIKMARSFVDKCLHYYTIWSMNGCDESFEFWPEHTDEYELPRYLLDALQFEDEHDEAVWSRFRKIRDFRPKNYWVFKLLP